MKSECRGLPRKSFHPDLVSAILQAAIHALLESMKRTEAQKESIIASLRKYEKEALIRKGDFSRGVEEQTHIKTKEDVR